MIKQTFYNLSKDKQDELMNILKSEIINKSITEISVATIANNFGIARSSLYNYFDNLEDLYYHILQETMKNINQIFGNMIEKNHNDIFETFIEFTNYLIDETDNEKDAGIIKSIFLYSKNSDIQKYILLNNVSIDNNVNFTFDTSMLKIKSKEDIDELFSLLNYSTTQILTEYFSKSYTKGQAKSMYKKRIGFIKNGVYKL